MSDAVLVEQQVEEVELSALVRLRDTVEDDLRAVDALILKIGGSNVDLVKQMGAHVIASGGKRLRPILTLACAKLCGYYGKHHIDLAAAVEFVHTATLLHDDVVDESDLRRGEATANSLWDNKSSVLVGDFLLGQAFCLMVNAGNLRVLDILSRASAVIAEGEVKQLVAQYNLGTTIEQYMDIITAKTAALFSAACEIMPVLCGKSEEKIEALRVYGLNLGIAFQIADDVLDYAADEVALGKRVGDDFREGKMTLPVILAYQKADASERIFWREVFVERQQHADDLLRAVSLMQKYQVLQEARDIAMRYIQEAEEKLSLFGDDTLVDVLRDVLFYTFDRKS